MRLLLAQDSFDTADALQGSVAQIP